MPDTSARWAERWTNEHRATRTRVHDRVWRFFATFSVGAEDFVTYEKFGAVGDGVHDDLPAICEAHEYANAHGLPVKTKPDATYHLGSRALTAIIATDTDWNTSSFYDRRHES